MLNKILELLYNKIFINLVINKHTVTVEIDIYSSKGIIDSVEENFETSYINDKMIEFIRSYKSESPYYYISILDISANQGVIPTCDKDLFSKYNTQSDSEFKCHDEKWAYYTSKTDLYEIEKIYKDIGMDFIFSPFSILASFFEDKINEHIALFVLVQENVMSLCIFEEGKLIFGEYLDLDNTPENEDLIFDGGEEEEDDDFDFDLDEGIDLEDVDVMDEFDGDDFGDIEDLDSIEDIDEFSRTQDVEEEFYQETEKEIEENSHHEGFNEDYQRYTLIQNALSHFYNDTKYDSKFVESIYIADGIGISPDLKKYLEEEMFLNVYVRHVDLACEVSSLAQRELNL